MSLVSVLDAPDTAKTRVGLARPTAADPRPSRPRRHMAVRLISHGPHASKPQDGVRLPAQEQHRAAPAALPPGFSPTDALALRKEMPA